MNAKRSFTDEERRELHRLCVLGRLGKLSEAQISRVTKLYGINPEEYAEVHQKARAEADASVNPLCEVPK